MMIGSEPNPAAYLWTKSEDYCCKAESASSLRFPPSGGGGGMSAPQADFMDTMNYVAVSCSLVTFLKRMHPLLCASCYGRRTEDGWTGRTDR